MRRLRVALFLALAACFVTFPLVSLQPPVSAQAPTATQRTEAMAPMRDGIKLATSIFLPEGNGPWPAVLVRTPYGKDTQGGGATAWTKR